MKRWPFPAETIMASAFIDQQGKMEKRSNGMME
jgi:hypothetical protein